MRLTFGDEVEAFRQEFLAWLAENRPSEEEMAADPAVSSAHIPDWARRWTRRQFDAGWLVPGWPPERGGRNAGPVETLVYQEELTKAGVPHRLSTAGNMFSVFFTDADVADFATASQQNTAAYRVFFHQMLANGVYLPPSAYEAWFLSTAHDDEAVERIAAALPIAAEATARAWEASS